MSRLLCLSAAIMVVGVGTTMAAELPIGVPGAPVYHGPVLLPFTWAGPYFGLNIGGQWTSDKISTTSASTGFLGPVEAASINSLSPGTLTSTGVIGGMQAGYNWQFDQVVVGLEADFEGAATRGNRDVVGIVGAPVGQGLSQTVKTPMFMMTVRPRLGWAFDHTLVYVTGGYAFATYQVVDEYPYLSFVQSNITAKQSGWTAGAGLEYAFYKGMSLKLEYLYVGLGSFNSTISPLAADAPPPPANIVVHHNASDNIVRLGLNFHFGWY